MLCPIKLVDVELSDAVNSITGLEPYISVQIMIRLNGRPVGYISAPVINGSVGAEVLNKLILDKHTTTIFKIAFQNALAFHASPIKKFCPEDLFNINPSVPEKDLPLVTIAVCTRDRPNDLALCIEALSKLDYT